MKLYPLILIQIVLLISFSCNDDEGGTQTACPYQLYDESNYQVIRSDIGAINEIIKTNDGFLAFGQGIQEGSSRVEFQLTKLTETLEVDWVKYPEDIGSRFSYAMIQTKDGGYLLCGTGNMEGVGPRGIYLLKTDADGHEEWTKIYTTSVAIQANQVVQLEDESYLLGGYALSTISSTDEYILSIDKNGEELWSQTYPFTLRDQIRNMVVSSDGNIILLSTRTSGNGFDLNLILSKMDQSGTLFWEVNLGLTSESGFGHALANTSDNQLVIGVSSATGGNLNSSDYLIYKIDEDGVLQWTNTFGNPESESILDVIEQDNHYYFLGQGNSCSNDRSDIFISKVDVDGNLVAQSAYGGDAYEAPSNIISINDNELLVTGHIEGEDYTQDFDLIVLKINNEGVPK